MRTLIVSGSCAFEEASRFAPRDVGGDQPDGTQGRSAGHIIQLEI